MAIGQKQSTIANVVRKLEENGALANTIVVAASAESAALQYLAPYSGCTMGEYFRDRGEDALIVYDDPSSRPWLIARSPCCAVRRAAKPTRATCSIPQPSAGARFPRFRRVCREVHQRRRDRQDRLATALPIIETQAGDVSAFVPTNVISITDGQIFPESAMFNSGIRPAVNAGISVSRRWRGPDQDHQEAVRRHSYRSGPVP